MMKLVPNRFLFKFEFPLHRAARPPKIDGRIAVILSPYDISCALEKGASLECKGYAPPDAARLGANVLLYALQQ